nr:glycoprotein precursor [Callicarpa mosaic-associated virus 2]
MTTYTITGLTVSILLALAISYVSNTKKDVCNCDFKLIKNQDNYVVSIPKDACNFDIPNSCETNGNYISCPKKSIAVKCGNDIQIFEKPTIKKCRFIDEYSCNLYNNFNKLVNHLVSYIIFYITRNQVLFMAYLVYILLKRLFPRFVKICQICGLDYFYYHNCRSNYKFQIKNIYVVILIILHIFSYKVTSTLEHSVIKTDSGSMLTISDTPNLEQTFTDGADNEYKIIILSTYIEYDIVKSKPIYSIGEPVIEEAASTCDGDIENCKLESGRIADYRMSKPRDNFACTFTQLKICFICTNEKEEIGKVYSLKNPNLKVSYKFYLNGVLNNSLVDIDTKFKKLDDIHRIFVDNNDECYIGDICDNPSRNCWGIHSEQLTKDVRVVDLSGSNFDLVQCAIPEISYKSALRYIDGHIIENKAVINVNLGFISFVIKENLLPKVERCDGKLNNVNIHVKGCYDCESGFTIRIESDCKSCCKLTCKINDTLREYTLGSETSTFVDHSSSEAVIFRCGVYFYGNFKLEKISEEFIYTKHHKQLVDPVNNMFELPSIDNPLGFFYEAKIFVIKILIAFSLIIICYITFKAMQIYRLIHPLEKYNINKNKEL